MKTVKYYISLVALLMFSPVQSWAQHPIDIQRLAANGQYFEAMVAYLQLPQRRATTESIIAAARSAWGLGLPNRAIEEYDRAMRDEKLGQTERARIYLSRAIIEYQEDRFQTCVLFAERAAGLINTAGPLRSKAWLIWAQALEKMNLHGPAEEQYLKSAEEADPDERAEIYYLLARTQMKLGKSKEASENFQKVPLRSDRTAQSVRGLAEVSLDTQHFDEAEFWLNKGRTDFPDDFLDSWVDYALVRIAISQDKPEKVSSIFTDASKRYAPSDHWFNLLNAAVEAYRSTNPIMAQLTVRK